MAQTKLQALMQEPSNSRCADCSVRNPKWASVNLGVFICECCAGIHRKLGTHISQVRSVKLDTWRSEWVERMVAVGNARAKAYYEQRVPENERYKGMVTLTCGDRLDTDHAAQLERWIRAKYEEKRYLASGAAPCHTWLADESKHQPDVSGGSRRGAGGWPNLLQSHRAARHHDGLKGSWVASAGKPQPEHLQEEKRQKDKPMKSPHHMQASTCSLGIGEWFVDAVRLQRYKHDFVRADTDRNGFISAPEIKTFLATSALPLGEMSRIWHLSDIGKDGQLSLGEFICAMHLTMRWLQGTPLPPALPQELVAIARHLPQLQEVLTE